MPIHDYHYTFLLDCGNYYERGYVWFEDENACFESAAYKIAFDDITNDVVESVWINGEEYEYSDWQPGMVIEFRNAKTLEPYYSTAHPEWDH